MALVAGLLYIVVRLFGYALLGRIVLDFITSFVRGWRPRGIVLILATAVYAVTDRPLAAVRSVIKPVSLGGISLDLGFFLLYFVVVALQGLLSGFIH